MATAAKQISMFFKCLNDVDGSKKLPEEPQDMQLELPPGITPSARGIITEADEEAIFRSGFPRPNNPYFATKRTCLHNKLFVPKRLVRDSQLTFPEQIKIHDEKGNDWTGNVHMWRDKRLWISRGWRSFCKWNNVKRGDWCIIEIVRPETPEAQIYLKTHLVPAATLRAAGRL